MTQWQLSKWGSGALLIASLMLHGLGVHKTNMAYADISVNGGRGDKCNQPGQTVTLNGQLVLRDAPVIGRFLAIDFSGELSVSQNCNLIATFPVPRYAWQISTKPLTSQAFLTETNTLTPHVWLDLGGQYVIQFIPCPQGCDLGGGIQVRPMAAQSLSFEAYSTAPPTSIRFRLEGFEIRNTMALDDDTDFVFLTAKVGDTIVAQRVMPMGDIDNGWHALNWEVGPLLLNQPVVLSYQIVNRGDGDTAKAVEAGRAIAQFLEAAGTALGIPGAEVLNLVGPILDLIFPNCDGVVLADNVVIDAPQALAGRVSSITTRSYTGPDTPWDCGSNAQYDVTWKIIPEWPPQLPPLQPVQLMPGAAAR